MSSNTNSDSRSALCSHRHATGHRCPMNAIRGQLFCYYHHRDRQQQEAIKRGRSAAKAVSANPDALREHCSDLFAQLTLHPLEDPTSIQEALTALFRAALTGQLPQASVGRLGYILQLALTAAKQREQSAEWRESQRESIEVDYKEARAADKQNYEKQLSRLKDSIPKFDQSERKSLRERKHEYDIDRHFYDKLVTVGLIEPSKEFDYKLSYWDRNKPAPVPKEQYSKPVWNSSVVPAEKELLPGKEEGVSSAQSATDGEKQKTDMPESLAVDPEPGRKAVASVAAPASTTERNTG
jgi:hypothetical protein